MQPDDALLEKLQKILALRDRAGTEGEAMAAADMLQKLLTKHNLEIADLEQRGAAPKAIGERGFDLGKAAFNWKLDLAEVIAKHYFCYALVNRGTKKVVFVGRPDNTEALAMLYGWVVDQIRRIASEERKKLTYHIDPLRWQVNFGLGCVDRLKTRLEELKRQQQEDVDTNALVLHHDAEIADYMEDKYGYRTDGRKSKQEQKWADEWEYRRNYRDVWFVVAHLVGDLTRYRFNNPSDRRVWTEEFAADYDAKREKEYEAWRRKEERNARRRTGRSRYRQTDWRKEDEAAVANEAGYAAADKVNLQPFLKDAGSIRKEELA